MKRLWFGFRFGSSHREQLMTATTFSSSGSVVPNQVISAITHDKATHPGPGYQILLMLL